MFSIFKRSRRKRAWNRGKLMGQKPPLKPKEICSIRIRLHMRGSSMARFPRSAWITKLTEPIRSDGRNRP